MSYLEEFQTLSIVSNPSRFLRLWEEYCMADSVDDNELIRILTIVKNSLLSSLFGPYAETALPLWKQIPPNQNSDEVLRLIIDLQTSNSPLLADLAIEYLKAKYQDDKHFNEKLRIVGLRSKQNFQGAIRNFELLTHMNKGSYVFHTGGWGVGEVLEASMLREHVLIEFEGIASPKEISFENAFKNLIPLSLSHFLSRRFGDPDGLEKEGKDDPIALIHLLLKDIGPKTAAEIKDELCGLVIPEEDWVKWWQGARAKLKKDTKVHIPHGTKDTFFLREEELTHETRLKEKLEAVKEPSLLISTLYQFERDFPEVFKNQDLKESASAKLHSILEKLGNTAHELAIQLESLFLLEDFFSQKNKETSTKIIKETTELEKIVQFIEIQAFKKRFLQAIRDVRDDWRTLFLHLIFTVDLSQLRDYLFKELAGDNESKQLLIARIRELLHKATLFPESFFWYFQKLTGNEEVPLNSIEDKRQFLEAYFVLLHYIEHNPDFKDLTKKMHQLLVSGRYGVIRSFIQGASVEYLQELILLASKCSSFTKQDLKILESLAEVVQPSLGTNRKEKEKTEEVIWTTVEGYRKIQERIHHIGTVETVDNAREIETARSHGDLRENSEYKFALERRARLQGELKLLTRQVNQARILTKEDISTDRVDVGTIVTLEDSKGKKVVYTLLGPWDANPEKNILSFQSKLAQAMMGTKCGESFEFQGETYIVKEISSFL